MTDPLCDADEVEAIGLLVSCHGGCTVANALDRMREDRELLRAYSALVRVVRRSHKGFV